MKWSNRTPELLAELSIRTQGLEVPLIHVLRHSRGYKEFLAFLKTELAPEGGLFWRAVDVLQDRCELWLSWRAHAPESAQRRIEPNMSTSRVKIPYTASRSVVVVDAEHSHVTMTDNVASLLEMCESIYESYVKDMSVHQVNIPMTMLRAISTDYEDFVRRARRALARTEQGQLCALLVCLTPNYVCLLLGGKIDLSEYFDLLDLAFTLFSPAKHEVFVLLKDDNFARWNKTASFEAFVHSMNPYDMT